MTTPDTLSAKAPAYYELFHCFTTPAGEEDHEHDFKLDCDWGFICNQADCRSRVDFQPCPDHAPIEIPGLRLVECTAEPRHYLYVHDRDDYGANCPACYAGELNQRVMEYEACRHRAWRRWRIARWIVLHLPLTGYGYRIGNGCQGCLLTDGVRWEWSR